MLEGVIRGSRVRGGCRQEVHIWDAGAYCNQEVLVFSMRRSPCLDQGKELIDGYWGFCWMLRDSSLQVPGWH